MKRILFILTLILSLTFSFTSCKKDNYDNSLDKDKTYIFNFLREKNIITQFGNDDNIYGDYIAVIDSVSGSIGRGDTFSVSITKGTDNSNAIWRTNRYNQTVLLTQEKQIIQYSQIGDSSDQLIDILKYEMLGDSLDLTGNQYKGIPGSSRYHKILLIRIS